MPATSSSTAGASVAPFTQRLQEAVMSLQFAWACGHFVTVFSTFGYFFSYFSGTGSGHYTRAFLGAFVSYAVVVYKTFGAPQPNQAFAQKLFVNENVHYLLLTILWIISPVYSVALIPFFVYSLFHLLGYTRTYVLPVIFPELRGAGAGSASDTFPHKLSRGINAIVLKNNPPALKYVAYFEIVGVTGSLILGLFTLKSLIAPLFYAQFLQLRYRLSPQARWAFADLRARLDGVFLSPEAQKKFPPFVARAYTFLRDAVTSYGVPPVRPDQPPRAR